MSTGVTYNYGIRALGYRFYKGKWVGLGTTQEVLEVKMETNYEDGCLMRGY